MLSYQFALIKGLRLLEVTVLIVGYLGTLLARETINSGSPYCPTGETKVDQNSSSKEDCPPPKWEQNTIPSHIVKLEF